MNAGGGKGAPSDRDVVGQENCICPTYLQIPDYFKKVEPLFAGLNIGWKTHFQDRSAQASAISTGFLSPSVLK